MIFENQLLMRMGQSQTPFLRGDKLMVQFRDIFLGRDLFSRWRGEISAGEEGERDSVPSYVDESGSQWAS